MKTGEFSSITSKNAPSENPLLYPTWGSSGLTLEAGEEQTRSFVSKLAKCRQGPKNRQLWDLDGKTDVAVTNLRLAYFCDKFVKGSGSEITRYSLTRLAVSSAVAGARRVGRAATGQVRYEWLSSVQLSDQVGLGVFKGTYLILECAVDDLSHQVWLGVDKNEGAVWATEIAKLAATQRLATVTDPAQREFLEAQAAEPGARQSDSTSALVSKEARFVYELPGAQPAPF